MDELSKAVHEHAQALKNPEHKKMASSTDFDQTMTDYDSGWGKNLEYLDAVQMLQNGESEV